jgi:hypothetical protein
MAKCATFFPKTAAQRHPIVIIVVFGVRLIRDVSVIYGVIIVGVCFAAIFLACGIILKVFLVERAYIDSVV